ncbi:MAG: laccase domain-containing protein [Propioniciclava sp.]|uniref:laccase domain-containing protein n=1 Tax=Propioniciclava sp. TaxID=2038686 RepID=UPI0039E357EA
MFAYRRDPDARLGVGVAFTSSALDLSDLQDTGSRAAAFARLSASVGVPVAVVRQVHGASVLRVAERPGEDGGPEAGGLLDLTGHEADALLTTARGVALAVRVADCVPVCVAAEDAGAVAAVHAGRAGLLSGVIGAAIGELRRHTGAVLRAWVGPHVCSACYEVPEAMAADSCDRLGVPRTATGWGTPSLDLGAAALAQLAEAGVEASVVGGCTLHDAGLHSHRGGSAGRLTGLVWIG